MTGKAEHEARLRKKHAQPQVVDNRQVLSDDEYKRRISSLHIDKQIRDFRKKYRRQSS